jgi:hypothetical protein
MVMHPFMSAGSLWPAQTILPQSLKLLEYLVDGCTFACSAFWFGSKWPMMKKKNHGMQKKCIHPLCLAWQ